MQKRYSKYDEKSKRQKLHVNWYFSFFSGIIPRKQEKETICF